MGRLIHLLREKIIKNSISLGKYGIHNLAWSKVGAQQLIGIPIIFSFARGCFDFAKENGHVTSQWEKI